MTDSSARTSFTTGAHWGFYHAEIENGRLVATRPLEEDPHPSSMIDAMPSAVHGPARVRYPVARAGWLEGRASGDYAKDRRGAEKFVRLGWDEALDLIAGELARVRDDHGFPAIFAGSYGWASAGRLHHAGALTRRFFGAFGGYTNAVSNYSSGAGDTIVPYVLGSAQPVGGAVPSWDDIAQHTDLVVAFGGMPLKNTQVQWGGTGAHMAESWMRAAKNGGVGVVSISPQREDCIDALDAEWWPARPSTDVPIMLALAHTLYTERLHDTDFLDRCTEGFDRFVPYLTGAADGQPKDADWAGAIAEIAPDAIRDLARRMAKGRTLITATWSIQRAEHGEQPYWMAITLAAMLGQIGLPGGGIGFGYGSAGLRGRSARRVNIAGMPPIGNPTKRYIPVARISDMLLNPGAEVDFNGRRITYPDVRLVYWAGGNPFHHHQDINKLLRAWRVPETIIVHETHWTATARHADIVLPATMAPERNDIGAGSEERFFVAMQQAVAPEGEARNDYDILADLGARLGCADAFTEGRDEMGWLRHIYDVSRQQAAEQSIEMPDFDTFWDQGYLTFPPAEKSFVPYASFRADPAAKPLKTPSGKIEIYSETIAGFGYDDCPSHPTWIAPREWLGAPAADTYPLHLMSNQPRHRLHSQLDSADPSRASKVAGREPIWINRQDAAARGIVDGDVVRVYNDRGACLAGVVVRDDIRPGVVKIETGAWFDPVEPGRIGALDTHGNPNMLTRDAGTSKLAQGPSANSCLVEIERLDGDAPPVTVFDPPEITER